MPSATEIATWQQANPDVALWCQDAESQGNPFHGRLWMDDVLTRAVRSDYITAARLESPDAAARMYEALSVPNGEWSVYFEGCTFEFRIWTVQRGVLAGQRIVKIRHPDGIYRGFAFITRDSSVRVWHRFRREAEQPHTRAVQWAVEYVRTNCDLRYLEGYSAGNINITRNCPICNRRVDQSSGAWLPLCGEHSRARDNHDGDEEVPRHTRPRRRVTPSEPLLCENGTGLVR